MTDTAPASKMTRPKKSGVVVPHTASWHQRLAAALIYGAIRVVSATIRFSVKDEAAVANNPARETAVFIIWHNRLVLSLVVYSKFLSKTGSGQGLAAIVSASKDGGLLARTLELFKVQPVRGSSSRRGPQALLELVSWGQRGFDLAITPDGPRGPCYRVQEGVISTAQLTGLSIVPVSFHLSWKIRLKSWDRFQIPLPFSKCEVHFGTPMQIPRDASEADRESFRKKVEDAMLSVTHD